MTKQNSFIENGLQSITFQFCPFCFFLLMTNFNWNIQFRIPRIMFWYFLTIFRDYFVLWKNLFLITFIFPPDHFTRYNYTWRNTLPDLIKHRETFLDHPQNAELFDLIIRKDYTPRIVRAIHATSFALNTYYIFSLPLHYVKTTSASIITGDILNITIVYVCSLLNSAPWHSTILCVCIWIITQLCKIFQRTIILCLPIFPQSLKIYQAIFTN